MLLVLIAAALVLVLFLFVRPVDTGAGSMGERWLEEQRTSHSD